MLVTLKPDYHVNPEEVTWVRTVSQRLPGSKEKKEFVAIGFNHKPTLYIDLDIAFVVATINNECTYTKRYTDEVGEIDICVLHENNSRYDASEGPHRPCLTVAPHAKTNERG